jgi:hypothetical protein
MQLRSRIVAAGVAAAATVVLASGSASAAWPDFSDCPILPGEPGTCIDNRVTSGYINIKGFNVPLGAALRIRGGLRFTETGNDFVPARGTNGVFGTPTQVPGGLLGIDLPISLNQVTATAELAGPPSAVRLDLFTFTVSMPLKLRLGNPLIGSNCHIGSNSNPARMNLIIGTTNPPPPNTPISGRLGTFGGSTEYLQVLGNTHVDNSFNVPGATGCGLGLGLINGVVNAKMRIPSAPGNNTMVVNNDLALIAP